MSRSSWTTVQQPQQSQQSQQPQQHQQHSYSTNNTTSDSDSKSQARYLYEVQGDPNASLLAYNNSRSSSNDDHPTTDIKATGSTPASSSSSTANNNKSLAHNHNVALLSYLSTIASGNNIATGSTTTTTDYNFSQLLETEYHSKMTPMPTNPSTENSTHETNKNNGDDGAGGTTVPNTTKAIPYTASPLVLAHNLALGYLVRNDPGGGLAILLPFFTSYSSQPQHVSPPAHNDDTTTIRDQQQQRRHQRQRQRQRQQQRRDELGDIHCKIAFLLLDCILALRTVDRTEDIIKWIEGYIRTVQHTPCSKSSSSAPSSPSVGVDVDHTNETPSSFTTTNRIETGTELKFRLNCYKSRTLFLRNKFEPERMQRDANIRLARKELKSAMEIYHHKLAIAPATTTMKRGGGDGDGRCGSTEGGGSVQESLGSTISNNNNSNNNNNNKNNINEQDNDYPSAIINPTPHDNGGGHGIGNDVPDESSSTTAAVLNRSSSTRTAMQTKKLDVQSQSALYMKANLEFLKGHTKKSLKLCSEAKNAGDRQRAGGGGMMPLFFNVAHHDDDDKNKSNTTTTNGGNWDNHNPIAGVSEPDHIDAVTGAAGGIGSGGEENHHRLTDTHHALHYNNIAIAHQAKGKVHVALHYYARSLHHVDRIEQQNVNKQPQTQTTQSQPSVIEADGMARPLPICEILYNASLCAQQASMFVTSYECMVRCITASPRSSFAKDPKCWLHLAENCIGAHSTLRREGSKSDRKRTRSIKSRISNIPSLVIESSVYYHKQPPLPKDIMMMSGNNDQEQVPKELGSEIDSDAIRYNPLPRALDCLNHCLRLCENRHTTTSSSTTSKARDLKESCRESVRVALAYVWMELNNPATVMLLADQVLNAPPLNHRIPPFTTTTTTTTATSSLSEADRGTDNNIAATTTDVETTNANTTKKEEYDASRRRRATMRMYACEASCMLGNPARALQYLLGHSNGKVKVPPDDDGGDGYVDGGEGTTTGNSSAIKDKNDNDDDAWYRDDAELMVHSLAMLDGGGGSNSLSKDDSSTTWKPWEFRRYSDAKASVQLALARACLLIGRVDTAKRLTCSVSPEGCGDGGDDDDGEGYGGSGSDGDTFPSKRKSSASAKQLKFENMDVSMQNAVLYYLIRDGKVKEALNILQASRMF